MRGEVSRRIELDPCVGTSAVYVESAGFGESIKYVAHTAWPAAAATLLSRWGIWGPFALRADLGLEVPLVRPRFTVAEVSNQETVLHRPSLAAARGTIGIELQFP